MEIELGVACGRCDRYNVLGSDACSCGQALSLGPPPAIKLAAPAARPAPESPPPSLFEKDVLKPRKVPNAASGGGGRATAPGSVPRPGPSTAALRAQASETALSSAGVASDPVSQTGRA